MRNLANSPAMSSYLALAVVAALNGCSKPAPVIPVPVPVAAPTPAGNNAAPGAAPGGANVAAAPTSAKAGAKPGKGGGAHVRLDLSKADPKTIFVVSHVAEELQVASGSPSRDQDKFDLAFADESFDSSNFVLDAIGKSSVKDPLIGKGKPKSGFTLPKGFIADEKWGYNADGLPLRIICEKTGSALAIVPAGPGFLGSDEGPDDCKPQVKVRIDTFYMQVVEVTVEEYEAFRTDKKDDPKEKRKTDAKDKKKDESRDKGKSTVAAPANANAPKGTPVLGVTWAAAQSYARWAGMELPTEAEFEKAARGPTGFSNPWGGGKPLWSARKITKTGSYPTDCSPYGIYDLAGNAKEWCVDHFSPNGHKDAATLADKEPLKNWAGPKNVPKESLRVVKGNDKNWNSWGREGKDGGGSSNKDIGFRCVLRIPTDSKES